MFFIRYYYYLRNSARIAKIIKIDYNTRNKMFVSYGDRYPCDALLPCDTFQTQFNNY